MRVQPNLIFRKIVITILCWQYAWNPVFMTVRPHSESVTLSYTPSSDAIKVLHDGILLPSQSNM